MESLTRSLNYEQAQELHFDKYAQQILENSRNYNLADTTTIALVSAPRLPTTFDDSLLPATPQTTSDFFKRLGATLIHSIQLQSLPRANSRDSSFPLSTSSATAAGAAAGAASAVNDMDLEFGPHHLVMDSHNYNDAMDELQKQLEYDKFMNEVWIGVVLTLIMISMIFCFCSCFLYHQFRMWKRNYRTTITQSSDMEAARLNTDIEDPVPEYTLVSGLPSYESALEILQKNPQSCMLVHPSIFEVFNKNEKSSNENSTKTENANAIQLSTPLLNDDASKSILPSYDEATTPTTPTTTTALTYNHSLASLLSLAAQKSSQCKSAKSASHVSTTASEAEKQCKS